MFVRAAALCLLPSTVVGAAVGSAFSSASSGRISVSTASSAGVASNFGVGTSAIRTSAFTTPTGSFSSAREVVTPFPNGTPSSTLFNACVDVAATSDFTEIFNKVDCVVLLLSLPVGSIDGMIRDFVVRQWGTYPTNGPTSKNQLAFSHNLFIDFSVSDQVWTQQDFIDAYYNRLSFNGGPFPSSVDSVIAAWSSVAAWTGFCQTKAIPYSNLADYLKYSTNVQGAVSKC